MTFSDTDPFTFTDQNNQVSQFLATVDAESKKYTFEDALNLANAARLYPTMSPELGLGMVAAGIDYNNPMMKEIVTKDAEQQHFIWREFKQAVSGGLNFMEGLWEEGVARPGRTVVRMYQQMDRESGLGLDVGNLNPYNAWSEAGASRLAMDAAAREMGMNVAPQTGWIHSPVDYGKTPQYGQEFVRQLDAGAGPQQAFGAADAFARQEVGFDPVGHSIDVAEQTQMHRTIDGETYASPYSLGRAAALQITTPGTVPFQVVSSMIDVPTRIGLDPIDYPALAATQWLRGRRFFKPNVVDEVTGVPVVQPDRTGHVLRRGSVQEKPVVAGVSRGQYATSHQPLTYEVEGYVFHGSRKNDVGALSKGGLSTDLERARQYAGAEGVVHAYKVEDLPKVVQRRLSRVGDVEQLVPGGKAITPEVQAEFDDLVRSERELHDRLEELLAESADELHAGESTAAGLYDSVVPGSEFATSGAALDGIERIGAEIEYLDEILTDMHREYPTLQGGPKANEFLGIGDDVLSPARTFTTSQIGEAIEEGVLRFGDEVVTEFPRPHPEEVAAGLNRNGRTPSLHGITADKWLTTGRGQRVIEFLRNETSLAALVDWLPELGHKTLTKIADSTDTAEIIAALRPHLGTSLEQAPRIGPRRAVLGAKEPIDAAKGFRAGISNLRHGTTGTMLSNLAAETGGGLTQLNPMDIDDAMGQVINLMRSYGADSQSIDRILHLMVREGQGSISGMRRTRDAIAKNVEATLKARKWDDDVVRKIMDEFNDTQQQFTSYIIDEVGNEISRRGENVTTLVNPRTGEVETLARSKAIFETQFAAQNVFLPNPRVVRRATSPIRKQTNFLRSKLGQDVLGLNPSKAAAVLDMYTSTWRSLTLLRVGWTLRVLPDEIARGFASGYGTLGDGSVWLSMLLGQEGALGLMGDSLDDLHAVRGLGAGTLEDLGASPGEAFADLVKGTRFDKTNTDWHPVAFADNPDEARRGLATAIIEGYFDRISTLIYDFDTIDEVIAYLRSPEGASILNDYIGKAAGDNAWSKVGGGEQADFWLRRQLEQLEATMAQTSGGTVFRRQYIDGGVDEAGQSLGGTMGPWVDGFNHPIDDFSNLNADELNVLMSERGMPYPGDGTRNITNAEKRALLMENEHGIDFTQIPAQQEYIIIDPGDPRIQELLAKGQIDGEKILGGDMTLKDVRAFEAKADSYFGDDYSPAPVQRVPKVKPEGFDRGKWTDTLFRLLGQTPTNTIVRSPFAKARYWDQMGRMYAFSDDATRAQMRAYAKALPEEVGGIKSLDRGIQRYLDNLGSDGLPSAKRQPRSLSRVDPQSGEALAMSIEEMDELAKNVSIQQTKDLFYDLSSKSNMADMMKHIAPFADAWWEILSTWGRLTNPYKVGGQALKNVRRPAQAIDSARRSGWFEEDEFGNEVFTWWPGAGMLGVGPTPDPLGVTGQASLSQAMFVDFGSPRSFLLPGASPLAQTAASSVAPVLPGPMSKYVDWFGNGDFPGTKLDDVEGTFLSNLPTWMNRAWGLIDESAFQQKWADEQIAAYQALANSGDPQYNISTPDGHRRAAEDSRSMTTGLVWGSILDAFVLPASPRYQIEFVEEVALGDTPEFYFDMVGLGREYVSASEYLGPDEAILYMYDRFGLDPLNEFQYVGRTRDIIPRPLDETSWQYYQDNPDMVKHMPYTMMAWVPSIEGDTFSQDAWRADIKGDPDGRQTREIHTVHTVGLTINNRRAYMAYNKIQDDYDRDKATIEARYGKETAESRYWRDELSKQREWEVNDLFVIYNGFRPGDTVDEVTAKPSGEDMMVEFRNIAKPGTGAHAYASDLNPDFLEFITFMIDQWDRLGAQSNAEGHSMDWWRDSTSETNPDVPARREWYRGQLQWKLDHLTDPIAKSGAEWIADRIMSFVIGGYTLDQPFILDPGEPPPPGQPIQSDSLNQLQGTG